MSLVSSVSLLQPRPFYARIDTTPFAILYVILFYYQSLLLLPIVLIAHLLIFMLTRSFVDFHAFISHAACHIQHARRVLVQASRYAGRNRIVDLIRSSMKGEVTVAGQTFTIQPHQFEFQKVTFHYDDKSQQTQQLAYPTSGKISDYVASEGFRDKDVMTAYSIWGFNAFDIPMPGFLDLYFEHLIAPFFVFQVICLVLWSLDDYW